MKQDYLRFIDLFPKMPDSHCLEVVVMLSVMKSSLRRICESLLYTTFDMLLQELPRIEKELKELAIDWEAQHDGRPFLLRGKIVPDYIRDYRSRYREWKDQEKKERVSLIVRFSIRKVFFTFILSTLMKLNFL